MPSSTSFQLSDCLFYGPRVTDRVYARLRIVQLLASGTLALIAMTHARMAWLFYEPCSKKRKRATVDERQSAPSCCASCDRTRSLLQDENHPAPINRSKRGLPRSGAKVGSILSQPGER